MRQIQKRHFEQTARAAGFHDADIEELFSDIAGRLNRALGNASDLARSCDMPESTSEATLEGLRARATRIL
jgi:hypothetical protein